MKLSELKHIYGDSESSAFVDFVITTKAQAAIIVEDMCEEDIAFLVKHPN